METQFGSPGLLAKQAAYAQTAAAKSYATEISPTAAQDALCELEAVLNYANELRSRLSTVADHLGVGLPPTDAKAMPQPVRSGIIGAIHTTRDAIHGALSTCHEYMSQIERQV